MVLPRVSTDPLRLIVEEIDGALELLGEPASATEVALPDNQRLGSLMEQCIRLCAKREDIYREPVRTIHHFACTGGTLFSKCVSAMPNVQLLSEINPFSTLNETPGMPRFAPTDVIRLMKQSTRGVQPDTIAALFLNALRIIHRDASGHGYRLVLRDHAHSQYCDGPEVLDRPDLRKVLAGEFSVLSVVTVRHPVQSYLSLVSKKWHNHFRPSTLDEYCRRYLAFLDAHAGVPIIRYEDLLAEPRQTIIRLCEALDLPFSEQFESLFGSFKLTGDSGRSSDVLEQREDKPVPEAIAQEQDCSPHCRVLLESLAYA